MVKVSSMLLICLYCIFFFILMGPELDVNFLCLLVCGIYLLNSTN